MAVSFANQLTPTNLPANTRILEDATLKATGTLPASNTTSNTGVIDLFNATPYPTTETINVKIDYTATTGNASNSNGTLVLMHSADNSTFANIPTLGSSPIVMANTVAAASYTYKLPPGCYRYIKCSANQPNVTNLSASVLTMRLLF